MLNTQLITVIPCYKCYIYPRKQLHYIAVSDADVTQLEGQNKRMDWAKARVKFSTAQYKTFYKPTAL
jgi:hypothetical protein